MQEWLSTAAATLFLLPFQRQDAYPASSRSRPAASSQPPPVRGS